MYPLQFILVFVYLGLRRPTIMALPLASMEMILGALLGMDNAARVAAEQELGKLKDVPDCMVLSLAQVRV